MNLIFQENKPISEKIIPLKDISDEIGNKITSNDNVNSIKNKNSIIELINLGKKANF